MFEAGALTITFPVQRVPHQVATDTLIQAYGKHAVFEAMAESVGDVHRRFGQFALPRIL